MRKNTQKEIDEAIIDHLQANDPDDKVKANYWRNQYKELSDHWAHDVKERRRIDTLSNLVCYAIYIVLSVNAVVNLCIYDPTEEWDTLSRLLNCLVLAINVGFGVFMLMFHIVNKVEKERCDLHWTATKATLELKGKLEVTEHNLEMTEEKVAELEKCAVKAAKEAKSELENMRKLAKQHKANEEKLKAELEATRAELKKEQSRSKALSEEIAFRKK